MPALVQSASDGSRGAQARRLMSLTDLTSLNDSDDPAAVRALATLARTSVVKPASVCIWPRFIPQALEALEGSGIAVCAVTNFPAGAAEPDRAAAETRAAIFAGAKEVDVVFPYQALNAGDLEVGLRLVSACREACQDKALLKVILETGQLDIENIRRAAQVSITGGADFLKTSTGKTQPGATPEAARVLIEQIAAAARPNIGFKASGGIRKFDDALLYLAAYEDKLGIGNANPRNFRIGASSLFKELMALAEEA